jgi:hypothetical protein
MGAAHGKRFIREQIRQETPPSKGERLESGSDGGTVEGVTEVQKGGGSQNNPSRGSGCPQLNHNELRPGKDQQGHKLSDQGRDSQMQRHHTPGGQKCEHANRKGQDRLHASKKLYTS